MKRHVNRYKGDDLAMAAYNEYAQCYRCQRTYRMTYAKRGQKYCSKHCRREDYKEVQRTLMALEGEMTHDELKQMVSETNFISEPEFGDWYCFSYLVLKRDLQWTHKECKKRLRWLMHNEYAVKTGSTKYPYKVTKRMFEAVGLKYITK